MSKFSLCKCINISGCASDLLVTINYNLKLYHCKNFSFYKNILFSTVYNDKILIFSINNDFATLLYSLEINSTKPNILIGNILFKINTDGTILRIN